MRAMRREDHRMLREEAEALLRRAQVLRLGLVDEGGPYVVPLNFGYEDGRIYLHGAPEGRRMDAIARDPRVCFEVDEGEIVRGERPCGYTSRFSSVVGYGRARVLETKEEKLRGLQALMRHYGGPVDGIDPAVLEKTAVVEIAIEQMDGKRHDVVRGLGGQ
ncbi:predicted flavin-nucleotide-binding protein [Coriobacteriaceae bacterium EMTCatB1]|nr:predicted flavin-nucleotide-binding protein [Coriobacteriaceae bacterium EMTCatB1]